MCLAGSKHKGLFGGGGRGGGEWRSAEPFEKSYQDSFHGEVSKKSRRKLEHETFQKHRRRASKGRRQTASL